MTSAIYTKLNNLSSSVLESLSEISEDYLYNKGIELTSHSYHNIIVQAASYGMELPFFLK